MREKQRYAENRDLPRTELCQEQRYAKNRDMPRTEMTAVGFEPTPLRTGALSQRLRPLGQTVLPIVHVCVRVRVRVLVCVCVFGVPICLGLSMPPGYTAIGHGQLWGSNPRPCGLASQAIC